MKKADTFNTQKWLVENKITTQSRLNENEPIMTHNQYRDYSEPSEEEYDDSRNDDENFDIKSELIEDLEKNNILLETFGGREYFIRCKGNVDFMVYFINDEEIEISKYVEGGSDEKNSFGYEEALDYILSNKNLFLTFDESVRGRNQEYAIDAQDRRNNAMERGGYGLG